MKCVGARRVRAADEHRRPARRVRRAIVASWLPGTEGQGVADTLFGLKPFTGRLPETWAEVRGDQLRSTSATRPTIRSIPYGWGLRTDPARARIVTVRDSLAKQSTLAAKLATIELTALLRPSHWNADGSVRDPALAFVMLLLASPAVSGTSSGAAANANLLVSVARDIAQAAVVANGAGAMSRTAALTANAEHDLLAGSPILAVTGLVKAWQTATTIRGRLKHERAGWRRLRPPPPCTRQSSPSTSRSLRAKASG